MLLEVNLTIRMETATIEQIHRVKQQLFLRSVDRLPAIKKLSRDKGLSKACAFKEFRFEPPYISQKKERKIMKLPSIPEHMLPRRHNSFDEDDNEATVSDLEPMPSLSISPAFLTEKHDERSLSVEAKAKSPNSHLFSAREFTFPEANAKRQKQLASQPSIIPAFTPRVRDLPLQAKIEKLAKQKRKEKAKKAIERRYERKLHNLTDMSDTKSHLAFKSRREPNISHPFHVKDHKYTPFKQMVRIVEESVKPSSERLYTRIIDGIYAYTKGLNESPTHIEQCDPYERLMVSPVTVKEEVKDDNKNRRLTYLPPIL